MTVRWNGDEAARIAEQAGMEGLRLAGELILREALPKTPKGRTRTVQTRRGRARRVGGPGGTLRRSGTVTMGHREVIISFNTPYARRWHEAVGQRINWSEPGTGPKYLENPFNEHKADAIALVQRRQLEALRRHP